MSDIPFKHNQKSNKQYTLCISPFTLFNDYADKNILTGDWCLEQEIEGYLLDSRIDYEVKPSRTISKVKYEGEANLCFDYYQKYIKILTKVLNDRHNVNYSERYWDTLLNGCLYQLIASIVDHYYVLKFFFR